ncbi:hypothetical protein SNEBB_008176 [Seison nebaliae]|nr:hypothetical protein SNEBB_008176 [Seison nebaliae]
MDEIAIRNFLPYGVDRTSIPSVFPYHDYHHLLEHTTPPSLGLKSDQIREFVLPTIKKYNSERTSLDPIFPMIDLLINSFQPYDKEEKNSKRNLEARSVACEVLKSGLEMLIFFHRIDPENCPIGYKGRRKLLIKWIDNKFEQFSPSDVLKLLVTNCAYHKMSWRYLFINYRLKAEEFDHKEYMSIILKFFKNKRVLHLTNIDADQSNHQIASLVKSCQEYERLKTDKEFALQQVKDGNWSRIVLPNNLQKDIDIIDAYIPYSKKYDKLQVLMDLAKSNDLDKLSSDKIDTMVSSLQNYPASLIPIYMSLLKDNLDGGSYVQSYKSIANSFLSQVKSFSKQPQLNLLTILIDLNWPKWETFKNLKEDNSIFIILDLVGYLHYVHSLRNVSILFVKHSTSMNAINMKIVDELKEVFKHFENEMTSNFDTIYFNTLTNDYKPQSNSLLYIITQFDSVNHYMEIVKHFNEKIIMNFTDSKGRRFTLDEEQRKNVLGVERRLDRTTMRYITDFLSF